MAAGQRPQAVLERLRELQIDLTDSPWPHRRDALLRSLRHEVEQLPRDARPGLVAALRGTLADEDGDSARSKALAAELAEVGSQRDAARRELEQTRERLGELDALREENERLRAAAAAGGGGGGGEGAAELLVELARGKRIDERLVAMSAQEQAAWRAVMALFGFVVDYEVMSMSMLHGLAGDVDAMGTQVLQGMRREFSTRFRRALEEPESGLPALKEQLSQSLRLIAVLDSALIKIAKGGSEKILDELDPDAVASKHTRPILGTDWGAAVKELRNRHGDIDHYLSKEIWGLYFQDSFKKELRKFLEP